MKRIWIAVGLLVTVVLLAQTPVDVRKISAVATGEKTAANGDSVSLPTDRGGATSILYDTNTNGKTTLIAGVSMQTVHVRGFSIINDTASTVTVTLGSGTGTNCVTTYAAKTPAYVLDGTTPTAIHGIVFPPFTANGSWFNTASGENLCVSTSAGVQLRIMGAADQF